MFLVGPRSDNVTDVPVKLVRHSTAVDVLGSRRFPRTFQPDGTPIVPNSSC